MSRPLGQLLIFISGADKLLNSGPGTGQIGLELAPFSPHSTDQAKNEKMKK